MGFLKDLGKLGGSKLGASIAKQVGLPPSIGSQIGGAVGSKIAGSVPIVGSFKKGGKVKKTGLAKVHKGERVLSISQNKEYEKMKKNKK